MSGADARSAPAWLVERGRGSATAAAIFALAGPSNARAAHAALVAVALERIARQGSAGIDGHCGSSGPAKAATRSIGVTLGGPDVEALLATMPEPPETSTEAAALPNAPSCINDESLACSGESTCAPIGGDNFCCRPPIPVTKVCFSDGDCGGPELCVPSGSQSSDGKTFTCASPNVSSCEATRSMVPMAPAGPNVADLRKQVDACINSVDYNNLKPRFAAAGETYTHRSGSTVWSVASYMGSAAGWLIDTAERSRAWVEYMTFGGTDAQAYLAGVITAVNGKIASGGWMNYQKVCIAQCISSRIIEYQQNALAKFGGVSTAVAQGVGVCTEFSAIMLRILESTAAPDVSASLGLSPGHAFVRVTFDGISYSVEPQNDPVSGGACTFYQ